MRRQLAYALAAALLAGQTARAAGTNATEAAAPGVLATNLGWQVGEKLTYRIYWGRIPVGTSVATSEWVEYEGRRLLALRMRTQSNRFIEKIYPVDDTIESLTDPVTLLPVRFTKKISEGDSRYHEVTTFDHADGVATWESKLTGKQKTIQIGRHTRDLPSLMYSLRGAHFVPGATVELQVVTDNKLYDVWLRVGEYENIKLPLYGKVRTIRMEPDAAFQGLFVRKGRLWMWVSDDPRCLMAQMSASIPVASIRAVLEKVEGPGDDAWTRRTPAAAGGGKD
jgi:hypothetical protein